MLNPTRRISMFGGQRYAIQIPCGQCAECREMRKTDIYFRTYYECLDTKRKGGYVLFDTLTYSNQYLPHISDWKSTKIQKGSKLDYSCFNANDIRLFMANLRRQLEFLKYDCKNKLKYFISSEYGSDKEYIDNKGIIRKGTKRPHYHILFFVTGDIKPLELSKLIAKCWKFGRTDGIPYHDNRYVLDHTFGQGFNDDNNHLLGTCAYVAKYVLKNLEYDQEIENRIYKILRITEEKTNSLYWKKRYKEIAKNFKGYTRWSKGFGLYGIKYNDKKLLYEGKMRIPNNKTIWQYFPLSNYLDRKLYWTHQYDKHGKLYWKPTEEGKKRLWDKSLKGVENFTKRFVEWTQNIDSLITTQDLNPITEHNYTKLEIKDKTNEWKDKIIKYLNDRNPYEFGIYVQLYKGRVKTKEQKQRESKGIFRVDDPKLLFDRSVDIQWDELEDMQNAIDLQNYSVKVINGIEVKDNKSWNTTDILNQKDNILLWNYTHHTSKKSLQDYIISKEKLHEEKNGKLIWNHGIQFGYDETTGNYDGLLRNNKKGTMNAKRWAEYNCINENSDPRFKDFDKLYNLYISSLIYSNKRKQKTYNFQEELKERYKNL